MLERAVEVCENSMKFVVLVFGCSRSLSSNSLLLTPGCAPPPSADKQLSKHAGCDFRRTKTRVAWVPDKITIFLLVRTQV